MDRRLSVILFMVSLMAMFVMPGAAQMSSTNYRIPTTVMSGGGGPMGSANFQMNSTLGQPSPLMEQGMDPYSDNFGLLPGFWYTVEEVPLDCDYLLQDTNGYRWCLNVTLQDSVGLYMEGTCDTGTSPAKQAQALYNWSGHLAMKAEQGSDGQLIQYHMRWGQAGMWIDETGAYGQVVVTMISSTGNRASFAALGNGSIPEQGSASDMLDARETRDDEDYCLEDSDGNLWYLYEIARDDRGIYFIGTCDTDSETLDVMATNVWPRSGLALTAYNGSAPNKLCSFRWYRTGQWINSSGATGTLTIDYCDQ